MTDGIKFLVATVVFFTGLAVVSVVWFGGGSEKQRAHPGLTVAAHIQIAREATLTTPKSSQDVTTAITSFASVLRAACSGLPPELAMPPEQIDEFVSLCAERLQLVMEPDYPRYLEHVRSLTGREIGQDGSGAFYNVRETWEKYAMKFRWLPINVDTVQVLALWKDGDKLDAPWGGHTTGVGDHKKYYTRIGDDPMGPRDAKADVYDVWVPVEVADTQTGSKLRTFFVLTLIRSPDEPRWMPRFMGVNDPSAGDTSLPPLWL
jgi:hypothetical protein